MAFTSAFIISVYRSTMLVPASLATSQQALAYRPVVLLFLVRVVPEMNKKHNVLRNVLIFEITHMKRKQNIKGYISAINIFLIIMIQFDNF